MIRHPRALGLTLGVLADTVVGDPQRFHPVAGFGRLATRLERVCWRDDAAAGALHLALCVLPVIGAGAAADRAPAALRTTLTALATWAVLGGATLAREARAMDEILARTDAEPGALAEARQRVRALVGRDPSELDADELARATVESLAENTSDAVVASLFWGAVAGIPGLLGHRAINTLDAMVGHRTLRYHRFGTAAARLDDLINLVPARLTGLLTCLLAPTVGGDLKRAWATMWRDHAAHPSPNGGWCEAAVAGALGVRLGGANRYGDRVEVRGTLGDGRPCQPTDIAAANRLTRRVGFAAAALAVAVPVVVRAIARAARR